MDICHAFGSDGIEKYEDLEVTPYVLENLIDEETNYAYTVYVHTVK